MQYQYPLNEKIGEPDVRKRIFTDEAGDFCLEHGIGVAERIEEL